MKTTLTITGAILATMLVFTTEGNAQFSNNWCGPAEEVFFDCMGPPRDEMPVAEFAELMEWVRRKAKEDGISVNNEGDVRDLALIGEIMVKSWNQPIQYCKGWYKDQGYYQCISLTGE